MTDHSLYNCARAIHHDFPLVISTSPLSASAQTKCKKGKKRKEASVKRKKKRGTRKKKVQG